MIDWVIIISITVWVILIADTILTFRSIRNKQNRLVVSINKMERERTGRPTLKTNISLLTVNLIFYFIMKMSVKK